MEKETIDYNKLFKEELTKQGYIVLKKDELKDIVKQTIPAFANYGLYHYFTPKYKQEQWINFRWRTFKTFYNESVIFTDSTRSCCAAIFFNKCKLTNIWKYLINGMWKSFFTMGFKAMKRIVKFEQFAEKTRMKHTSPESFYWFDLVVKPEAQKKGIATGIFNTVKAFCDKYKHDLYFETHTKVNANIYERQGCTLVETLQVPFSNLVQYCFLYKHK